MDAVPPIGDAQQALWNGPAGQAWVDSQALLDDMFRPFEQLLAAAVPAGLAGRVLDIGCGTGAVTLAAARRLAAGGLGVGVDISAPMLEAARTRAAREQLHASFILADAQAHAFEPASFDVLLSRFGVMFFADPELAFRNLRRAAKNGAALRFAAWRSAAENPFMTTAERAAAPLLPELPPRAAGGPGQFAFADRDLVQSLLARSGWAEIDIRPIDVACTLPESALTGYLRRLGPLGLVLQKLDEQARDAVMKVVRAAFEPYVQGAEVHFTAACWLVSARA